MRRSVLPLVALAALALGLVTVAVLLMAAYDFYRLNTTDKPRPPRGTDAGH